MKMNLRNRLLPVYNKYRFLLCGTFFGVFLLIPCVLFTSYVVGVRNLPAPVIDIFQVKLDHVMTDGPHVKASLCINASVVSHIDHPCLITKQAVGVYYKSNHPIHLGNAVINSTRVDANSKVIQTIPITTGNIDELPDFSGRQLMTDVTTHGQSLMVMKGVVPITLLLWVVPIPLKARFDCLVIVHWETGDANSNCYEQLLVFWATK